ncbi:MAG TPA: polysaccharide deacetylase, partial [Allosphingosinicella sp.]
MPTRVLLTVDTELTSRHYRGGASWHENFERSYDPAGVGIPYQLRVLAEHKLKACFFVDPMPALLYGIEPVRRMVEPILEAGQEVQLHLHPFWRGKAAGLPLVYELNHCGLDEQRELIETARRLLIEAGALAPIAFRAGGYAANADTLAALAALGIRYDSSHNGSHHPWPSALPLDPDLIDPIMFQGVIEIPVTHIRKRGGGLRHLQICAVSAREMEAALRHAERRDHSLVTIVSHSFELATRDGLRPNKVIGRRVERLCAVLADRRAVMPTTNFASLP